MSGNPPPVRLLFSYSHWDARCEEALTNGGKDIDWILDSGAFTAWRAGTEIELGAYCDFIDALEATKPSRYFMLDVIGDPDSTWKNYQEMLKRGYHPLPVFTRGDSLDRLDAYYETSDVVAVGGLVKTKGNTGFVKGIMEYIGDRNVHWLGFARANYLNRYRPYMCDSSSFQSGLQYYRVDVYVGRGKFLSFGIGDMAEKPSDALVKALLGYGIDPREFAFAEGWKRGPDCSGPLQRLICESGYRYQKEVWDRMKTRLYFASSITPELVEGLIRVKEKSA